MLAVGVSPQQVKDALAACAAFSATSRLADVRCVTIRARGSGDGVVYLRCRCRDLASEAAPARG